MVVFKNKKQKPYFDLALKETGHVLYPTAASSVTTRIVYTGVPYKCIGESGLEKKGIQAILQGAVNPVIFNPGQLVFCGFNPADYPRILQITNFQTSGAMLCNPVIDFLTWERTCWSENGLHQFVNLWTNIFTQAANHLKLSTSGLELSSTRNAHEISSVGSKRVDKVVFLNHIPIIKIEEKSTESELGAAQKELVGKMSEDWLLLHNDVPFFIGVAVAGWKWSFHKIDLKTYREFEADNGSFLRKPMLELDLASNRELGIIAALRLASLLQCFNKLVPPRTVQLEKKYERGSKQIRVCLEHVEKFYPKAVKERVSKVLQLISTNDIKDTIRLQNEKDGRLFLGPVGRECHPGFMTIPQIFVAIRTVLSVLKNLHTIIKWCHCDVRWPNIIFVPKTKTYILVDFEFACPINSPIPDDLKSEFKNPNLLQKGQWDQSGDTYQVVLMVEQALKVHGVTTPVCKKEQEMNFSDADQLIQELDALAKRLSVSDGGQVGVCAVKYARTGFRCLGQRSYRPTHLCNPFVGHRSNFCFSSSRDRRRDRQYKCAGGFIRI